MTFKPKNDIRLRPANMLRTTQPLVADGKTIYYNEQTRDGLDVVSIPFDPAAWKAMI